MKEAITVLIICLTILGNTIISTQSAEKTKITDLKIRTTIICGDTAELSSACVERVTKAMGSK